MAALVAAPMSCRDVVAAIGAAIAARAEVLSGCALAKLLAAVDAQTLLGLGGRRTVFLESARHGDLQRLNFESPVRKASERAPTDSQIGEVRERPLTVEQPCSSTVSVCAQPRHTQGTDELQASTSSA